jgi:hypothetical protein
VPHDRAGEFRRLIVTGNMMLPAVGTLTNSLAPSTSSQAGA